MPLTDIAVRKAKTTDRPIKLSDGGGLYLLVRPDGARYWRMDYRWAGRRGTLAFGVYPTVTLAEAREARTRAKKQIAAGLDPATQRKLEKIASATANKNTFRAVADEWLQKAVREGRAKNTISKVSWLLRFTDAAIGGRPISEISALELLEVLRRVEGRGRHESARRLRSTCGQVFRYAIATGRAERDPSVDLRGALTAPKVAHRAAITEPAEIGALLRAIDGYDGYAPILAALRLAPFVFVRPGELRQAEWTEFDLEMAEWRIPPEKMKMRLPHRVPLAMQSIAILRELRFVTGEGRYLFPSVRSYAKPISENTLNATLRRLGYTKDEVTMHGFRSTAAVRLNEMGCWNPDAIERQLAHKEPNAVRNAYVHAAEYWKERCEMMQVWADQLDQWRDGGAIIKGRFDNKQRANGAVD
jgi:integrase